jgi:predicted deacylase
MPKNKIELLGHTIASGKEYQLNLDIAKLHTRTRIQVPIVVAKAKKEGPVLLITGGIHGNEINGVEIVRQLISKKYHIPEKGMIICIPVVNVFGFLNQERQFPDGRDLNRVFPGSPRGSLASRFAHQIITQIAPLTDYCIDFHTGGDSRFNIPQIRINQEDPKCLELAKVFRAPFIIGSPRRDKSFRESMHKLRKKVLLFEGGKSNHISPGVTQMGLSGALRVIQGLGMRNFKEELSQFESPLEEPILIKESKWIRANYSGMFHPKPLLGKKVKKGAVLGSVSDPFGYFERNIKAAFSGYVLCINESPIVVQGDAVFHISKD